MHFRKDDRSSRTSIAWYCIGVVRPLDLYFVLYEFISAYVNRCYHLFRVGSMVHSSRVVVGAACESLRRFLPLVPRGQPAAVVRLRRRPRSPERDGCALG